MNTSFRAPSVPLITVDPYFSIWSPADRLYDKATVNWTEAEKPINGFAVIDGEEYRFMGEGDGKTMEQKTLKITATSSEYVFEIGGVLLTVTFRTPLLLHDLKLMSRPCSYMDFSWISTDGGDHDITIRIMVDKSLCYDKLEKSMFYGENSYESFQTVWMGQTKQAPLSHSGDRITIDWGYFYLSAPLCENVTLSADNGCVAEIKGKACHNNENKSFIVLAYDDIASIVYFGDFLKGYWAKDGAVITDAIGAAISEHNMLRTQCALFDETLHNNCLKASGVEYAQICALAYRQSIAAHKLVADIDGNVIFLSKECDSNGCIGTVDVSYPSVPLYLLFNPELVKAMMRPIMKFARMPVWEYEFAPHDVGRYPYACGQAYGVKLNSILGIAPDKRRLENGDVHPMYYQFPAGGDIYDLKRQMPVEECGNMIIMMAAVVTVSGDNSFAEQNMDLLEKWVCYLLDFGADPGEQLCTDDFAGHLARNVNLAAKAIMGIASYSIILDRIGRKQDALSYMDKARKMAAEWEKSANSGEHTLLTFGSENTWSMKYNTVWDKIFATGLFSDGFFKNEIDFYLANLNKYGLPLDSRESYTKSDWILWCAAFSNDVEVRSKLIQPIYNYLMETESRVPFSDWYDTKTGKYVHFINRTVQGGLFMPLMSDMWC